MKYQTKESNHARKQERGKTSGCQEVACIHHTLKSANHKIVRTLAKTPLFEIKYLSSTNVCENILYVLICISSK